MATPSNDKNVNNPPQAKNDAYAGVENGAVTLDVMGNDLGGGGKSLYSVNQQDPIGVGASALSAMGASISIVNGKVLYTPTSASIDALKLGETAVDTFTYTIQLGDGAYSVASVSITLTGTNDGPIAVLDTASGTENQTLVLDVLANDTDVDQGHVFTLATASAPVGKGAASVVANKLAFDPGTDFDHLKAGATEVVTLNYTMTDEHGAASASTVTLTVTGVNDGPVAVADIAAATENQALTIDVLANDADVDDGHVFTLASVSAPAGKGSATVVDNKLAFNPGTDFDHLKAGATEVVTLNYTMTDEHGAASSSAVTLTVTGVNDGPVAVADIATVDAGQTLAVDVVANDTDVDDGAVLSLVSVSGPAGKGSASVVDGKLVFDAGDDFGHLPVGQVEIVVLDYVVRDAEGATSTAALQMSVVGTNHDPVLATDAATHTLAEIATVSGGSGVATSAFSLAFTDVNLADSHTLAVAPPTVVWSAGPVIPAATSAALASALTTQLATDSTGTGTGAVSFSFALADRLVDFLASGETLTVTYAVTVTDNHGAASTKPVSFTITGANDAPVVTPTAVGLAMEGGQAISLDALAGASDADHHAQLSVVNIASLPAGVTYDAANHQFTLDPGHAAYQQLSQGQVANVTASYGVSDGAQTTAAQVSWKVVGANDPAAIGAGDFQGALLEADRGSAPTAPSTPQIADAEANNSFATAQVINAATMRIAPNGNLYDPSVPALAISGAVSTTADNDYFRIDLKAGQLLTLDIDTVSSALDSYIFLYDAAGNPIVSNDDSTTSSGGGGSTKPQDSFLQFTVPTTGTYYILVKDFDQGGQSSAGPYVLNVSLNDQSLPLSDSGQFSFTDIDLQDTHSVTVTPQGAGYVGALTATVANDSLGDGTGQVAWSFSTPASDVQFLRAGQVVTQTYDLALTDSAGDVQHRTVSVNLTGVNDAPLVNTGPTGGLVYATTAPQTVSGTLGFVDVDLLDTHTLAVQPITPGDGAFAAYLIQDSTGDGSGQIYWEYNSTTGNAGEVRYLLTLTDNAGGSVQQMITMTSTGTPLPAGAGNDTLTASTGADTLTGGAGNDVFVFQQGRAGGDVVTDFDGHLSAPGDSLRFVGYGNSSFAQVDATHWAITYNGGASQEVITFANAPTLTFSDYIFV